MWRIVWYVNRLRHLRVGHRVFWCFAYSKWSFQDISMDFVTKLLPSSKAQNTQCPTIVDHFSKLCMLIPCKANVIAKDVSSINTHFVDCLEPWCRTSMQILLQTSKGLCLIILVLRWSFLAHLTHRRTEGRRFTHLMCWSHASMIKKINGNYFCVRFHQFWMILIPMLLARQNMRQRLGDLSILFKHNLLQRLPKQKVTKNYAEIYSRASSYVCRRLKSCTLVKRINIGKMLWSMKVIGFIYESWCNAYSKSIRNVPSCLVGCMVSIRLPLPPS